MELALDLPPQLAPELVVEPALKPAAELVLELGAERAPQSGTELVTELIPDLAREGAPELTSQLVLELAARQLAHELVPELLPELSNDSSGIDAAEGRIHPYGQGRLVKVVSLIETTNSLDDDGSVDRGRSEHIRRPLVADSGDDLAVGWREDAGVGRERHAAMLSKGTDIVRFSRTDRRIS